jgi:hypothetical protein
MPAISSKRLRAGEAEARTKGGTIKILQKHLEIAIGKTLPKILKVWPLENLTPLGRDQSLNKFDIWHTNRGVLDTIRFQ